jgi:transposase
VPKLTPERQKAIVEAVAAGVPRKFAAMRAGITERCLYLWLAKGRKGGKANTLYVQLFHAVQKAEADAVARNVAIVQKAGAKSWQAAAWWLERRYHAEFGRKDRTFIQTPRRGRRVVVPAERQGRGLRAETGAGRSCHVRRVAADGLRPNGRDDEDRVRLPRRLARLSRSRPGRAPTNAVENPAITSAVPSSCSSFACESRSR